MSKIFNGNYTRLDDDVSFQLVRTNPILTTNTKLMYDGENMYFESYDANALLTTQKYKNVKIKGTSPYNYDLRNFLVGTSDSAYDVFQNSSNTEICDTYDNQFETMYWCGAESINSGSYEQELGFVAPLYIRKKLPNYFVIFKVDGPTNYNLNLDENGVTKDDNFDLNEDIIKNAKIIKTFDLREGTVIGNYIKRYTEQKGFEYDKSVYVNFSTGDITFYGIDKYDGVLVNKVEKFDTELLENDNTITHSDDWITSGFYRNGLIFPYIINFEFLFDDEDTKDYKFSRYFGMYCNDIDLYKFEARYQNGGYVIDEPQNVLTETILKKNGGRNIGIVFDNHEELSNNMFDPNDKSLIYYIKDKKNILHKVEDIHSNFYSNNNTSMIEIADETFDLSLICGFEESSVSVYCERLNRTGKAEFSFTVNKMFKNGESIKFYNDLYSAYNDDSDSDVSYNFGTFVADDTLPEGTYKGGRFSINGTLYSSVKALCGAINTYDEENRIFSATYCNDVVVIRCLYTGENMGIQFRITCDDSLILNSRITINSNTDGLEGGCDNQKCTFKVNKDEINKFTNDRYLKTSYGNRNNARILSCVPYVDDNGDIDGSYYEVSTDENGEYVGISNTNMVEIVDRYYPTFGILSFFPVKDFDFDTVLSSYGSYGEFKEECERLDSVKYANLNVSSEDEDDEYSVYKRESITTLSNGYMFDNNGNTIENEYEYFMENVIPELSVKSKVVPYIAKWGYYDDWKDSCDNVYRLNTSKIFGTSNMSSNTFTNQYSINEHTHSMPYYLTPNISMCDNYDEYQYIYSNMCLNDDRNNVYNLEYNHFVYKFVEFFMDTETDNFDELTYTKSIGSKRFARKYSRFKFGNDKCNPTTLFRGVKFDVTKIVDGVGIKSSEFNDYRFTFLYIPIEMSSIYSNNTVYFVKNDTFKFIVGFVLVNPLCGGITSTNELVNSYSINDFCKAYLYGGCYGILDMPVQNILNSSIANDNVIISGIPIEDIFDIQRNEFGYIELEKLSVINTSVMQMLSNLDGDDSVVNIVVRSVDGTIKIKYENIVVEDNSILKISSDVKSTFINIGDHDIVIDITLRNKFDSNGDSLLFKDFYNVFETLSTYNIKSVINEDVFTNNGSETNNVKYFSTNGDSFKMSIKDPLSFNVYDIFCSKPTVIGGKYLAKPSCSYVGLKSNVNSLKLKGVNRYSGYYNPIFRDVLMYDDYCENDLYTNETQTFKYSNTKLDYDYSDKYGKFGEIKNIWFHKVNEDDPGNILTLEYPYYPSIGEFALDYRDYNIFESNWDKGYFTKQNDISTSESVPGTYGMKNNMSMFGSKYMNVPETLTIDTFDGTCVWDDDFITDSSLAPKDIMYKEINDNVVNFYMFIYDRIVRYFAEESDLKDEFVEYINPIYSYGSKLEITDDIYEYVEKNIMKLYYLDSIRLWVKRRNVGVHDSEIENDYDTYMLYDNNSKIENGLQKINTFGVSKITSNLFDRKLSYNLKSGYEEKFGLSFTIKKI